ncbi:hypothetical protein CDAR_376811 [Caerostris darwini]|uniref:Uncharacterized protein n=1 Tax=Caerostris darwini TaxID=1538125 RepID=A0AAV4SUN8_9ARAC|nr:hypothetical protein CDAR_376811 [Caerostris darwini]
MIRPQFNRFERLFIQISPSLILPEKVGPLIATILQDCTLVRDQGLFLGREGGVMGWPNASPLGGNRWNADRSLCAAVLIEQLMQILIKLLRARNGHRATFVCRIVILQMNCYKSQFIFLGFLDFMMS